MKWCKQIWYLTINLKNFAPHTLHKESFTFRTFPWFCYFLITWTQSLAFFPAHLAKKFNPYCQSTNKNISCLTDLQCMQLKIKHVCKMLCVTTLSWFYFNIWRTVSLMEYLRLQTTDCYSFWYQFFPVLRFVSSEAMGFMSILFPRTLNCLWKENGHKTRLRQR